MKRKPRIFLYVSILLIAIVLIFANIAHFMAPVYYYSTLETGEFGIAKAVQAVPSALIEPPALEKYQFNYKKPVALELGHTDLTNMNLSGYQNELSFASFDTETMWPHSLPKEFNPKEILENGKKPGLGIEELHNFGIDGSGVSIAIIGPPLYTDHNEYSENLVHYEEYHIVTKEASASADASAYVSIAAGKTTGVAPGVKLYYFATDALDFWGKRDVGQYSKIIERVLEFNDKLPENEQISAIALEDTCTGKGSRKLEKAIQKAKNNNVFVLTVDRTRMHTFQFSGLGRNVTQDLDDVRSYTIAYQYMPLAAKRDSTLTSSIFVPMDAYTVASPFAKDAYVYNPVGKPEYSLAYLVGLYALAVQVNPDVTPAIFSRELIKTSQRVTVTNYDNAYTINNFLSPVDLIATVAK